MLYLTVDNPPQGVIGVKVGRIIRLIAGSIVVCDGVELPIASIGIIQCPSTGIGGFRDAIQIVVLEGNRITVTVDLLQQVSVLFAVLVIAQLHSTYAYPDEIAKAVVVIGVGLSIPGSIRPHYAAENPFLIIILKLTMVCKPFLCHAPHIVISCRGDIATCVFD